MGTKEEEDEGRAETGGDAAGSGGTGGGESGSGAATGVRAAGAGAAAAPLSLSPAIGCGGIGESSGGSIAAGPRAAGRGVGEAPRVKARACGGQRRARWLGSRAQAQKRLAAGHGANGASRGPGMRGSGPCEVNFLICASVNVS
jgi:hypothetical protein